MVVSLGWLQIIAWKMGASPFKIGCFGFQDPTQRKLTMKLQAASSQANLSKPQRLRKFSLPRNDSWRGWFAAQQTMQRNASIVPEICFVFVDGLKSYTNKKVYIGRLFYGSSFVLRTKIFSLSACFFLPFEEDGADRTHVLGNGTHVRSVELLGEFAIDANLKGARWANLHVVTMVATKPHLGALAIWQKQSPLRPIFVASLTSLLKYPGPLLALHERMFIIHL